MDAVVYMQKEHKAETGSPLGDRGLPAGAFVALLCALFALIKEGVFG
jgi:hypothetical protein